MDTEQKKNLDSLQWWRTNAQNFQYLSKLARIYLAIPATSATSERYFSKTGLIVTDTRTLLKPSKVDKISFISKNMHIMFLDEQFSDDEE